MKSLFYLTGTFFFKLDLAWQVMEDMVKKVGTMSADIFENNTSHQSNYGILAKSLLDDDKGFNDFVNVTAVIFKLAKDMSEHKAKYETQQMQLMFNLVQSFLKAQQKPTIPKMTNANVIKHIVKAKVTRKPDEFVAKTISKKMAVDFISYCGKWNKNQVLLKAGMTEHTEELAELDILK